MELGLRGRKALVTGASKGIGRACAEVLAEEGCDVVLVSRTAADLEAAQAAIVAKHNVAVSFYPLDLSDSRNVDKLAAECADIDLLVNNAGAIPGGDIAQIDEARWRTAWDLKVFGYINMTRRFYALMAAAQEGRHHQHPRCRRREPRFQLHRGLFGERLADGVYPGNGRYGTARWDARRRDQPRPGYDRPARQPRCAPGPKPSSATPERWTEYMTPLAFGRAANPEEIGWMTAFLASDLSAYTTGSIVTIDGGG